VAALLGARAWLGWIWFVVLVSGVASGSPAAPEPEEAARIVLGVVVWPIYILTYLWMKADARERTMAPPAGATPLIVFLLPVAVAYYLVATQSGWHKAVALAKFAGFVAVSSVVFVIGVVGCNSLAT
jgi:hypothetical protein